MPKRQVLLVSGDSADGGPQAPVGSVAEVIEHFARFNTAPQDPANAVGSGGIALLYGPGMLVEVPAFSDEVAQVMVTMTDQDFAFPVLVRCCRGAGWRMLDPESGRSFG